jgi:hypothetical protein
VDPTGTERAGILLDQDNQAFLAGEISQDELLQRFEARGQGAIAAASLFTPGPEELLIAAAGKALGRLATGAGGRIASFFSRFLGKADETAEVISKGKTSNGISVTRHGVNQKINRNVRSADELDAIKNPLDTRPIKTDALGRPSQRTIGRSAEVVRNPETGTIISVNPTSTKKAERLLRNLEEQ